MHVLRARGGSDLRRTVALDRAFDDQAVPQDLVGRPTAAASILNTIAASMVSLALGPDREGLGADGREVPVA